MVFGLHGCKDYLIKLYVIRNEQNIMNSNTPVSQHLAKLGIPHREFRHPGPIHSLEQAAEERGQKPEQVVRSILFRVSEGDYLMVLVAGPAQISWPDLRHYLGESRISMAPREEVESISGYPVGAVSPFGLPREMRILVDENVFTPEEVSIGSGVRGTTVILRTEDLRRALSDPEIGRFQV
jgi:Cys-tRNA(Pro) deacylase